MRADLGKMGGDMIERHRLYGLLCDGREEASATYVRPGDSG
jgi:hypothetical protein